MSNIVATVAVSLALAANAPTQAPQPAPAKSSEKAAAKNSEVKYCLTIEAGTGSRLARNECRTRAQWARQGVNVDKPEES